jgi:hypothetical protein
MKRSCITAVLLGLAAQMLSAQGYTLHTFKKIQLTDQFWAEGATAGDLNRDGHIDIVAGPFWYEGPDFTKRHEYYPATKTYTLTKPDGVEEIVPGFEGARGAKNSYSDNFLAFIYDFNGDGWDDILIYGFPGKAATWYENPKNKPGHWKAHAIFEPLDNESPAFVDITGDGRPEIVCNSGGHFGFARADWSDPSKPWTFVPVTPKGKWHRFTHGLGVGDVNGDGRMDLLEAGGWWEQPESLEGNPVWKHHPFTFGVGGAQMFAYDVNGNGRNDIITSLAGHGFGLAWYEQIEVDGQISFREHIIMNKEPHENNYGVKFSQLHALDLADIDGDGVKDLITGKRFWAHGPTGDPEPNAPAVLYWFKLVRGPNGEVDFIPHLIDDDSGVGTQVVAARVRGNEFPDIVMANKKGAFVFLNTPKNVGKAEWEAAQPKPFKRQE